MPPKPSGNKHEDLRHIKGDTEKILKALERKKPSPKEQIIRALLSFISGIGLAIVFFCGIYKDGGMAGMQNTLNIIAFMRTTTATMQARWMTVNREIQNSGALTLVVDTSKKGSGFIDKREWDATAQLFEWCSLFQSIRNNGNQMLWADSLYTTDVNFWAIDDDVRKEQGILQAIKYNLKALREKYRDYSFQQNEVENTRIRVNEVETRNVYEIKMRAEKYQWWYWIGSIIFAIVFIIEKVRFARGLSD